MKGGEIYGGTCCKEPVKKKDLSKKRAGLSPRKNKMSRSNTLKEVDGRMFKLVKIFGDGHCMYRSIGAAVNPEVAELERDDYGLILDSEARDLEEAAAMSLRSRVASYMKSNWDKFPTVLEEERAPRLSGIRGGEWAGEEELLAVSLILGVPITVHDQSRTGPMPSKTYPDRTETEKTIHLRYTRNQKKAKLTGNVEAGGHYELLVLQE